jgi:glycosyltransferase involved in cell wall biosynthesis
MEITRSLLHIWLPNLNPYKNIKGGIQVYSEFLIQAMQNLYPKINYEIFSKHDTSEPPAAFTVSNTRFNFLGNWPLALRTAVFAIQLLLFGIWQRPRLVLTIHLNFTPVAYWLKRLTGIPYWTVAHGVDAWDIKSPSLQRALHHADRILSVSEYTRDRLLKEQNIDPKKISILPNTFDANLFKIAPKPVELLTRYNLTPEQPVILTLGRLSKLEQYKGYDKILASLPQIRQTIPNVHYIIAGKGDDRSRVENLIAELNLQDCVTLAGFIPDAELCQHYNLCDVFAMPSKGEGFGIVYLEALACGKPTLGGNKDGALDALCHGELGALVDPDNVDEIAQTLIQILQGKYSHPIMYQPEILRKRSIEIFGFQRFQQTLAELLHYSPIGAK